MSILVTRPHPDNEATAENLRARVMWCCSRRCSSFEPVAFHDESEANYSAIIVTSGNAIRGRRAAIAGPWLKNLGLLKLPLFAVGEHTAAAARAAGFAEVIVAAGDAAALRDRVMQSARDKVLKRKARCCIWRVLICRAISARNLAPRIQRGDADDLSHGSGQGAAARGLRQLCQPWDRGRCCHYSRRSARAFLDAARDEGVEISALAIPQCCLSETVRQRAARCRCVTGSGGREPGRKCPVDALERALRTRLA